MKRALPILAILLMASCAAPRQVASPQPTAYKQPIPEPKGDGPKWLPFLCVSLGVAVLIAHVR